MKRTLFAFVVVALAAVWLGCQPATDSAVPASVSAAADSSLTLVTLKVPNMT